MCIREFYLAFNIPAVEVLLRQQLLLLVHNSLYYQENCPLYVAMATPKIGMFITAIP